MSTLLHATTCSICHSTFLSRYSDEEVIAAAIAEHGADAYGSGGMIVCESCHTRFANLVGAEDAFSLPEPRDPDIRRSMS